MGEGLLADGAQPARKGRAGPCGGQPSVTSYFSRGGNEGGVGPERAEADLDIPLDSDPKDKGS